MPLCGCTPDGTVIGVLLSTWHGVRHFTVDEGAARDRCPHCGGYGNVAAQCAETGAPAAWTCGVCLHGWCLAEYAESVYAHEWMGDGFSTVAVEAAKAS